jgi:hypothetical protein
MRHGPQDLQLPQGQIVCVEILHAEIQFAHSGEATPAQATTAPVRERLSED